MIVFDLRCGGGHVFEAWFGSSAAYVDQRATGLIACPICGDASIDKALMAPNIAAKGNSRAVTPSEPAPPPEAVKAVLSKLAAMQRKMLDQSTWVGAALPQRARAMHRGDEDIAPIHGQASPAEARALLDEGVEIVPLPLPVVPPETCN